MVQCVTSAFGTQPRTQTLYKDPHLAQLVALLGDLFHCYLVFCNDHLCFQPRYQRNIEQQCATFGPAPFCCPGSYHTFFGTIRSSNPLFNHLRPLFQNLQILLLSFQNPCFIISPKNWLVVAIGISTLGQPFI